MTYLSVNRSSQSYKINTIVPTSYSIKHCTECSLYLDKLHGNKLKESQKHQDFKKQKNFWSMIHSSKSKYSPIRSFDAEWKNLTDLSTNKIEYEEWEKEPRSDHIQEMKIKKNKIKGDRKRERSTRRWRTWWFEQEWRRGELREAGN